MTPKVGQPAFRLKSLYEVKVEKPTLSDFFETGCVLKEDRYNTKDIHGRPIFCSDGQHFFYSSLYTGPQHPGTGELYVFYCEDEKPTFYLSMEDGFEDLIELLNKKTNKLTDQLDHFNSLKESIMPEPNCFSA